MKRTQRTLAMLVLLSATAAMLSACIVVPHGHGHGYHDRQHRY